MDSFSGQGQHQGQGIQVDRGGAATFNNAVFNNHYASPAANGASEEQKRALISSLHFPNMDTRRNTIKKHCPRTCDWLLATREWQQWQTSFEVTEHSQFLWIKGHAATGKSTLMKFALDNMQSGEKEIVISHFFHARGDEMERSIEGMFRTILVQLIRDMDANDTQAVDPRDRSYPAFRWTIEKLVKLFGDIVRRLPNRPLTLFIDALDECPPRQVREMIEILCDFIDETQCEGLCFRVCMSSRHYQYIAMPPPANKTFQVVLEEQPGHEDGIRAYVERRLRVSEHFQDDETFARHIRTSVQAKSGSIFLWCVLVIGELNTLMERGADKTRVEAAIEEQPKGLKAKLEEILEPEEAHEKGAEQATVLCMQLLLFSAESMTSRELWWAIHRGLEPETETDVLSARYQEGQMKLFILEVSKGLIEIEENVQKFAGYYVVDRVQFIHESVRHLLLHESGLAKLMGVDKLPAQLGALSHDLIKHICYRELFIHADSLKTTHASHNFRHWLGYARSDDMRRRLPLLRYAAANILTHANSAQRGGIIDQSEFLADFEQQKNRWINLKTDVHGTERIHEDFFESCDDDLLSILLMLDVEELVPLCWRQQQAKQPDITAGFSALDEAIRAPSLRAVQAFVNLHLHRSDLSLWRCGIMHLVVSETRCCCPRQRIVHISKWHLLNIASEDCSVGTVLLLGLLPATDEADQLLASLSYSCTTRFKPLLGHILENPAIFEARERLDIRSIFIWAVEIGNVPIAKVLLDNYASVYADAGISPLYDVALCCGGTEVSRYVVSRSDIDVNHCDIHNKTPLHYACAAAHGELVSILVATEKANVNAKTRLGDSPLHLFCRHITEEQEDLSVPICEIAMPIQLMHSTGRLDLDIQNDDGNTALHEASRSGLDVLVGLLLDLGANPYIFNKWNQTPRDIAGGRWVRETLNRAI